MVDDFDSEFRAQRFMQTEAYREWEFADRKGRFYLLDDPSERVKFIQRFIALANISYRYGRISRLLFGITDDYERVGVENQAMKREHLKGVDFSSRRDLEELFQKKTIRTLHGLIEECIEPKSVIIKPQFGWIEDHLFVYFEILADFANPFAYRIKKNLDWGNGNVLLRGQSWRRRGEETVALSQEDSEHWLSYNDCPVIYGQQWQSYFERLQGGDFAKAADLPGYLEPRTEAGELLLERVKKFLESDQTLLVIEGRAGMGKTKFLQRLVCELARTAVPYVRDLADDEPPRAWIPVYKELQKTPFRKEDALDKCIINWWNANGKFLAGRSYPKATSILKRPNTRWLVCLDGLDEMREAAIKNFYEALSEFREQYPQVKVLITTRPDTVESAWEREGVVITMSELDDKSVHDYLGIAIQGKDKQINEVERKRVQAREMLEKYSGLAQLVRVPLCLDAYARFFVVEPLPLAEPPPPEISPPFITSLPAPAVPGEVTPEELISRTAELGLGMEAADDAFETASEALSLPNSSEGEQVGGAFANEADSSGDYPPPPLTQVLDRMVERIWEHDRKHFQEPGNRGSAWEPLQHLKHLAAKVDGRDRFALDECHRVLKRVKWRARMLSLGLIELRKAWLFFPSRLLQNFLAADYLWHLWRGKRKNDLRQLVSADTFWRETQELFHELALPDREAVNFVSQLVSVDNGAIVAQPGRQNLTVR